MTAFGQYSRASRQSRQWFVLAACGGGNAETSTSGAAAAGVTTTQSAASPEETIAPDTEVTAGAAKLKGVARRVANAGDRTASKKAAKGLEPVWRQIESTVKNNEAALCLDVEDGFQRLEGGDRGNVTASVRALTVGVDAYLGGHPG